MLEQEIAGGEGGDKQCSSNREKNDKNSVFDLGCEPGKEYLRITELLVSSGADVNLQDKNGRTPIMIAALAGHKNLVQMLLKTGKVKLSIVDNDGFGSITYAKTQEIREMIVVYL
jgi:ankyrin repeat protein